MDLGCPMDVYVTKNHAYVVSIDNRHIKSTFCLSVLNVSNQNAPVLEKVIKIGRSHV